jgi:2-amino-4-hydroxy-6-hydroxymethyldihydropteridine diphosphokinase
MEFVIAVGANLGNAEQVVNEALANVAEKLNGSLVACSSLFRTAPVGGPDQPDFVNAVAIVDTELEPGDVLTRLQAMENDAGRVRDVRWGPRTLDLDVIVAGQVVSDDPVLTIPHPRAHERAFVLVPWLEIDPSAQIPGVGAVRDLVDAGFDEQDITLVES